MSHAPLVECGEAYWVPDEQRPACPLCDATFSLFIRRHHCRRCGEVVCEPCSAYTLRLCTTTGLDVGEQRVCSECMGAAIRGEQETAREAAASRERAERRPRRKGRAAGEYEQGDPDPSLEVPPDLFRRPPVLPDPTPELEPEPEPELELPSSPPQPSGGDPSSAGLTLAAVQPPEGDPLPPSRTFGSTRVGVPDSSDDITVGEDGGIVLTTAPRREARPAGKMAPHHRLVLELFVSHGEAASPPPPSSRGLCLPPG
jgi:hypothetical protein